MKHTKTVTTLSVAAALAGAVSLASVVTTPAEAAGKVKCYGISKAGENDCANKAGTHSCAGQSTIDYDGGEWKVTKSAAACEEAGGKTTAFNGVNPNIKS